MKIQIEVDIFGDAKFCDSCDFLHIYQENESTSPVEYTCALFGWEDLKYINNRLIKCNECKTAYQQHINKG